MSADQNLGDNTTPDQKEARDKLAKLRDEVEELIRSRVGTEISDHTYFLQIRDTVSSITVYTGAGCPVCAVLRSLYWLMENNISHDIGESNSIPFPLAIAIPVEPPKKGDIH